MNKIEKLEYIEKIISNYGAKGSVVSAPDNNEITLKINELITALNALIEERNAPTAKSEVTLTIPTADEVCKMLDELIIKRHIEHISYTRYDKELNSFYFFDNDDYESYFVQIVDDRLAMYVYEFPPKTLLAIALFYTYGEGKR